MKNWKQYLAVAVTVAVVSGCGVRNPDGVPGDVQTEETREQAEETQDRIQEDIREQVQRDKDEGLTGGEDTLNPDQIREKYGEDCIAEQTFAFSIGEDEGEVYFVPFAPSDRNPGFHAQVMREEKILFELDPYVPESLQGKKFESLDAVSFWDVNFDGLKDIVMIETYGGTQFAAVYYCDIYPNRPEEERYHFWAEEELSEAVSAQAQPLTIAGIRNLLADGKINGEFDSYAQAYKAVVTLSELTYQAWQEEGAGLTYDLIYVDEDNIPELVAGKNGYFVSLYTWHDGTASVLMDEWGYGAMGNAGYEFSEWKNSIRNDNFDGAGLICHRTYMKIQEHDIEELKYIRMCGLIDQNHDGQIDAKEEEMFAGSDMEYGIYVDEKEISREEYASVWESCDTGEYEYIEGVMEASVVCRILDNLPEPQGSSWAKEGGKGGGQPVLTEVIPEEDGSLTGGRGIYFVFTDGTVVTRYLKFCSSVEDISYQDVTGDGIEEVIVSTSYANTYADCFQVYIFQIQDGTVRDISPSFPGEGFSGQFYREQPWFMEILQEHDEKYTIALKLSSYEKIAGFTYVDIQWEIGYTGSRWERIRSQEIPEWKQAYVDYLTFGVEPALRDTLRFGLADAGDGETPKLLCYTDGAQTLSYVLSCEYDYKNWTPDGPDYLKYTVKEMTGADAENAARTAPQVMPGDRMTYDELRQSFLWEF